MAGVYSSTREEYATRGAYAYVSMIQREERKNKADATPAGVEEKERLLKGPPPQGFQQ